MNILNMVVGFFAGVAAYYSYLDGLYHFTVIFIGLSYWAAYLNYISEKNND
jgi:hypothetical protein